MGTQTHTDTHRHTLKQHDSFAQTKQWEEEEEEEKKKWHLVLQIVVEEVVAHSACTDKNSAGLGGKWKQQQRQDSWDCVPIQIHTAHTRTHTHASTQHSYV